jgi:hypothetical protein
MRSAFALCLLAVTLAACGAPQKDSTKDFKGAERGVASAVEALESAARDNDAGKTCTQLFAASLLATVKAHGTDCVDAVKRAFKDATALDLTVEDVTIAGAKATATVTSGTGSSKQTDTLGLEKVRAGWRISALPE